MKPLKEHIVFRLLTVLLVITLLVPAGLKLAHVFEHHKHEVCKGGNETHIHKVDLDCKFQKFQLNHHLFLTENTFNYTPFFVTLKSPLISYKYLINYQHLSFSLRAPPHSV